jgi:hypothetical protein
MEYDYEHGIAIFSSAPGLQFEKLLVNIGIMDWKCRVLYAANEEVPGVMITASMFRGIVQEVNRLHLCLENKKRLYTDGSSAPHDWIRFSIFRPGFKKNHLLVVVKPSKFAPQEVDIDFDSASLSSRNLRYLKLGFANFQESEMSCTTRERLQKIAPSCLHEIASTGTTENLLDLSIELVECGLSAHDITAEDCETFRDGGHDGVSYALRTLQRRLMSSAPEEAASTGSSNPEMAALREMDACGVLPALQKDVIELWRLDGETPWSDSACMLIVSAGSQHRPQQCDSGVVPRPQQIRPVSTGLCDRFASGGRLGR